MIDTYSFYNTVQHRDGAVILEDSFHTKRGNLFKCKSIWDKTRKILFSRLLQSTNVQFSNLFLSSKCVTDTM